MTSAIKAEANAGRTAIEREMARQAGDALDSFEGAGAGATAVAEAIRATGRLLLLGMGASHAAARIVEPLYRALGVDAIALPLSEQLTQPLSIAGKTVIVTSQSGESAEVGRWFETEPVRHNVFGMTLDGTSRLAGTVPSLVASGGAEVAFAATRSLTVTLALHLAVLARLGVDPAPALAALKAPLSPAIDPALAAFADVGAIVCSGRALHGVAEALALGLMELSRIPAFALEGGQFRHGPLEMLGPGIGVALLCADEPGAGLIAAAARSSVEAGSPVVVFDSSGAAPVAGALMLRFARASGLAAAFALLPAVQRFMLEFASRRVGEVGIPRRSSKITRTEE
jgi:fructoselysine-6-P-deglycase FrlB-like protein